MIYVCTVKSQFETCVSIELAAKIQIKSAFEISLIYQNQDYNTAATASHDYITGPRLSEKDWYYLQAQTDMPFHYLKLLV